MLLLLILYMGFVFQSVADTDVPVTKGATNVTDSGFTANWEPVADAVVYGTYAILTHTALSDETYYIVDDQFDLVDRGTEEEPFPGYEDFEYLDKYMNRTDWTIFMPLYISGQIGLDNRFGDFLQAELCSPPYDLSHDKGKVSVDMTTKSEEQADSIVLVLCDSAGVVLDSVASKLNPEWTEMHFELNGGVKECYLKVKVVGMGIMYLDNLRLSQHLQKGESVDVLYTYAITDQTFYDFLTSDKLKGDSYSYKVAAFINRNGSGFWSDYSLPEPVTVASTTIPMFGTDKIKVYIDEDLHVILSESIMINVYSANGTRIASHRGEPGDNLIKLPVKGFYVIEVGDKIYRSMK